MTNGYLHLADGTTLEGSLMGKLQDTEGEVVFTTAMTGYPQSITDPSYAGQILVFTYPLMGNYGVPERVLMDSRLMANVESDGIALRGIVVSSLTTASHHDAIVELDEWVKTSGIPLLVGIDTRALTLVLRENGVLMGAISTKKTHPQWFASVGHLADHVSVDGPITYKPNGKPNDKHIVLIDCGVKHGILRTLLAEGYRVTRIPWDADPLAYGESDGVVCSNGPGDPTSYSATIRSITRVIEHGIPFLGICLGHQLLSLAVGAKTYKLLYGHRGINQPCMDVSTRKSYLTSQNHGYAVKRETIPPEFDEWFVNLNDGTNEGIRHKKKPIRSVQFHPEGCPGPFDTRWILTQL